MKRKFTAKENTEIVQSLSSVALMANAFLQGGDVIM